MLILYWPQNVFLMQDISHGFAVHAHPCGNTDFNWSRLTGVMIGPPDTPFEGAVNINSLSLYSVYFPMFIEFRLWLLGLYEARIPKKLYA